MKKYIFLFLIFIFSVIGGSAIYPKPQITLTDQETAKIYSPFSIHIPSINKTAYIEPVGEDEEGRMGVPKNYLNAGWWNKGVKPAEMGSAVIAGHIDTPDGNEGIFYNLDSLVEGDEILITDSNNNIHTFVVVAKEIYKDEEFPIDLVFDNNNGRFLNLITCKGFFNKQLQNYSDRVVVFSILKRNTS